MAKKDAAKESSGQDVTLVFVLRENGELRLLKIVPRAEAVAYAEEFGAILVDAEQYAPHLG